MMDQALLEVLRVVFHSQQDVYVSQLCALIAKIVREDLYT